MRYTTTPYSGFDFVGLLEALFETKDLSSLQEHHEHLFKVGADSSTSFHKRFYDKYRAGWPEMVNTYEDFVRSVVAPTYPMRILYQRFPTFRIHLPGNVAVGAFHNDAAFGHPKGEKNYIIPLTNSDGSASVWVESEPGKQDFEPMRMRVGELIAFDGNVLTHGNHRNCTNAARVSMDFRILPLARYHEESAQESITLGTKFKEGEYYKLLI